MPRYSADTVRKLLNVTTNRDTHTLKHGLITEQIIGAFYEVYNALDFGFVESVYCKSLQIALERRGLLADREAPLQVHYENRIVGDFRVDLLVERCVIVEMKTADKILTIHERQLRNYLRSAHLSVGLILNAAEKPSFRRLFWDPQPHEPHSVEKSTEKPENGAD